MRGNSHVRCGAGENSKMISKNYLSLSGAKSHGVFLEKQAKYMKEYFTRPRKRYYKTINIFECIERHIEYDRIKRKLRDAEK